MIKSESPELEDTKQYQELVSKIQDKIRSQDYSWLMNSERIYPQDYPDMQAKVKDETVQT